VARRGLSSARVWLGPLVGALLLTACVDDVETAAPAVPPETPPEIGAVGSAEHEPRGTARVAVPEAPTSWLPLHGTPTVVGDVAALWGLPLYHLDAAGQPRPALVDAAAVDESGREVTLTLRPGLWSDGQAVTARDLAATVEALQEVGDPTVEGVEEVIVASDHEARVVLDAPTRTWPGLLGRTGVLPGHVLADGGLQSAARLGVTGGPFRLEDHRAGLRSRFVAHADGPLGAPGLEVVDVAVVPSFDTALGLLRDGDLDALVGHLAVRVGERVATLSEDDRAYEAAVPMGGTSITMRWRPDGALDAQDRGAMADGIRVDQQVDALDLGTTAVTPVPGLPYVPPEPEGPVREGLAGLDATLVLQREQEMLSLAASLMEAQVRGREGRLRIVRLPSPDDVRRADDFDGQLAVRRDAPWTSLASWSADGGTELLAGDRVPSLADVEALFALEVLDEEALETPLYRARVAHVWRSELEGIAPSSWPGAGFTSAIRWRWTDDS
jgi:ABC-type transport system substrate-binding protein